MNCYFSVLFFFFFFFPCLMSCKTIANDRRKIRWTMKRNSFQAAVEITRGHSRLETALGSRIIISTIIIHAGGNVSRTCRFNKPVYQVVYSYPRRLGKNWFTRTRDQKLCRSFHILPPAFRSSSCYMYVLLRECVAASGNYECTRSFVSRLFPKMTALANCRTFADERKTLWKLIVRESTLSRRTLRSIFSFLSLFNPLRWHHNEWPSHIR